VSPQNPDPGFRVAEIGHHPFDLEGQIDGPASSLWIGDGKIDCSLQTPQLGAMDVDDGSCMVRTTINGCMGQGFTGRLDGSIGPQLRWNEGPGGDEAEMTAVQMIEMSGLGTCHDETCRILPRADTEVAETQP